MKKVSLNSLTWSMLLCAGLLSACGGGGGGNGGGSSSGNASSAGNTSSTGSAGASSAAGNPSSSVSSVATSSANTSAGSNTSSAAQSSTGASSSAGNTSSAAASSSAGATSSAAASSSASSISAALGVTTGNPFAGAGMYVNPDYAAAVQQSVNILSAGSNDARIATAMKSLPTGVWIDRIDAIEGGALNSGRLGVEGHLKEALAQQKLKGGAMTITFVVYDLPDRDCASAASNGELNAATGGMSKYKTQYIDKLYSIFAKSEYKSLRITLVIEPDSLPNLVTNAGEGASIPACVTVKSNNTYVEGVQYAVGKFATLTNVYQYLDIAHSGWLGWDNNRARAVSYFKTWVGGIRNGDLSVIRGFVTNVANYTPLDEPFFNGTADVVNTGGSTAFYEWNYMVDELSYVDKLRAEFVAAGFPSGLGFMIDTGRNGWGSALRPTSAAADVDNMRIDLRNHRGNWCNVRNTGVGARPKAAPDASRSYLDAYYWVKGPGESDGTSDSSATSANSEGKRFDVMCGSGNIDALQNAPHAGHWFHDQFMMLVRNASPAL
ncbi:MULTISPECIES: glycoside hydrolase family 6 protein [unclassified Uliginosibacterium]|uniref:glycoside hydrolase family 6 protein n=1 Tax=unclassified Uliginosibacterium TaxID=2621521 RepID=UPI00117F3DA2|nr:MULTISPECIES: glycoside hydrolase family 6 protein [unclassified Uliginosibacterium]MDO6386986.1 glycoside hydrolase family 6 protein [Uliginosibacterium sp. 31-12]